MLKFKSATFYGYLFFVIFLYSVTFPISVQALKFSDNSLISSSPEDPFEIPQIAVPTLPVYLSPYADKKLDLQYANLFFDPLVRWSSDHYIEKRLVRKWTTHYTGKVRFYLKENIKFHSGNKLTSRDVVWTYQQIKKSAQALDIFSDIQKIKRINKYTFDIYTKLPEAQLLDVLTHFFILDARFYRQHKISMNKKYVFISTITRRDPKKTLAISGTGPFEIASFNVLVNLKVKRNNEYWGEKSILPYLDFVLIKSHHARVYSLIAGDVSISENVKNDVMPAILYASYLKLVKLPPIKSYFLTINTSNVPQLAEKSARVALELAINQQGIINYLFKGYAMEGTPWENINKPTTMTHRMLKSKYDIESSRALLKKYKVPNHLSLLVMDNKLNPTSKISEVLFNMLKYAGITLLIKKVTTQQQWDNNKAKFDLLLGFWHSDFVIMANLQHSLFYKSCLSPVLLKNFSTKNAEPSVQEYINQIDRKIKQKQIIPLFSEFTFFAVRREFNLDKVFSVNGIPYWSNLGLNKPSSNKEINEN
ncbi:MAG: ABC transporter substrate-binding protein [Psychromonas sp.]|nr:ABC transporter substrate-binding protein [Psychromonas sp.]